jgi:hypothetical protein
VARLQMFAQSEEAPICSLGSSLYFQTHVIRWCRLHLWTTLIFNIFTDSFRLCFMYICPRLIYILQANSTHNVCEFFEIQTIIVFNLNTHNLLFADLKKILSRPYMVCLYLHILHKNIIFFIKLK